VGHSGTIAAAIVGFTAASAIAQVVDTRIPLNYNFHGMAHQGEAVTNAGNSNADGIYYRSIADRGLVWDSTNPHAFGTNPIVGGTGIPYGLFDTLGYSAVTGMSQSDASAFSMDSIHLGSRSYNRGFETTANGGTSTGDAPSWSPLLNITSISGDGATATATTDAPHNLFVGQTVDIAGASPAGYNGVYTVTGTPSSTTFTYANTTTGASTGSIFTNSMSTALVTGLVGNGTTVTATTLTPHGFSAGNTVNITGSSASGYNGQNNLVTASGSTFTYTNGTTDATSGMQILGSTCDHTGAQVTNLASPVTLDAQSEIGILYTVSDSGGQFDCVLGFVGGGSLTVRFLAPDWFGAPTNPNIISPYVSSQTKVTHTVSGTTYTSFQGVANNDSAALQTFQTGNGGPNLNVIEGIISVPKITAAGINVVGQQVNRITFGNVTWPVTQITALTGTGSVATATVSSTGGFVVGQPIVISGVSPASYNGTYTIASIPSGTTFMYNTSATGTTANQMYANSVAMSTLSSAGGVCTGTTATAHGFTVGQTVQISGVGTTTAYNGFYTVATTPTSTTFTFLAPTTGSAAAQRQVTRTGVGRGFIIYGATARTGIPLRANCATADIVGVGDTVSDNLRCTGGTASGYGNNDTTVAWFRYTATHTGDVEARTCGSVLDTTVAVVNACGGSPIAGNDNGGCGTGSRVRWSAVSGQQYLIRVAGNNAAQGAFTLHIDDPAHIDITVPLAFNWNGIVNGPNEQTIPDPAGTTYENRCDLNGYRAIADRGLLCDGIQTNALNYGGGAIGYSGMFYSVYGADHQADMIHMGNRTIAAGGIRNWSTSCPQGTTNGNGLRPNWINNDDQTTPQTSDLSAFGAVFGPNTMLGLLYHMSNVDTGFTGTFDVTLTFTDGTSVTLTPQATDWFGTNTQVLASHNNTDGYGLESQQVLGIYHGTSNTDRATDSGGTTGALKVDEAVISTASILNKTGGTFNPVGKTLQSITFLNMHSGNAAGDTTYSALGVYSATLRDPQSYNQNFGPSGIASINVNPVTVGGTARMQVAISRGGGSPNNITSVRIDASSINQGTIVLNDSGQNGDVNPNDNTWSRSVVFPVNSTPGTCHLPFTVTDAQNRTFSGTLSFGINAPTATANPASVAQEGTTLITVPLFPNSAGQPTNIQSVVVDASSIQSGSLSLNDSGTNGDVTAGDGIWSGTLAVYGGATLGAATLPVTITDVSARQNTSATVALTVTAAPVGACCMGANCSLLSTFNCNAAGGVPQGVGTNCGVPSYAITDSANPYSTISGSGAIAAAVSNCDDCTQDVPLPFIFTFFDGAYSDVFVSSNGNLQFGTSASTAFLNDAIPTTAAPNNAIYPLWDDYNTIDTGAPNGSGDIYYTTIGNAPNRQFIVEWFNVTQYTAAGTYPMTSENFQVVLYEGSNNIEFRYGQISPPCNSNAGQCTGVGPDGDDRTVGVEDSTGTTAYTIPGSSLGTGGLSKLLTYHTASSPCAPSTGSCCTSNTCQVTTQDQCTNGTWTAGGTCTGPSSCFGGHFCGSADFNCDGAVGTDADIESFFACLSGNCPGLPCISNADFNGDGAVGTDADIESFFRVLSGGPC
jgi:hypothetical protein